MMFSEVPEALLKQQNDLKVTFRWTMDTRIRVGHCKVKIKIKAMRHFPEFKSSPSLNPSEPKRELTRKLPAL